MSLALLWGRWTVAIGQGNRLWPIGQHGHRDTGFGQIIMSALRTFIVWIVGFCCFLPIGLVGAETENPSSLLIPCDKQPACQSLLQEAQRFEKKKQNEKALWFYELAYEKSLDPRIYVYIGRIQNKQKKYKEAIDSVQLYLDSHLDDARAALMKDALALLSEAERSECRAGQQLASVHRYSERLRIERRPRSFGPQPRDSERPNK